MGVLDTGIILLYFVAMLCIGIYASRKQRNTDDYYVAGRKMGTFAIMCLWLSSWIGGAAINGTSARAYEMGITSIWYVAIIAVGLVVFALVMTRPAKRLSDKFQNVTFPDFIENRYDSKTRLATTITTILAYIAYTASQFVAGAGVLNALTGWPLYICFIVIAVVIVAYTSIGGMLAVAYTDVVQMILLVVGIVIVAVPLSANIMVTENLSFSMLPEEFFDIGACGWPFIAALGVSTIFSFFTCMDGYTKVFSAKDEHTARRGTLFAAVVVVVIAVSATYLGLVARVALPGLESGASSLPALIMQKFPVGIKGLVLVAILAAIMSTGDVCVLTASSNITKDLYARYINPNVSDKKMLTISVISSVVIGAVAALFAWYEQDIVNTLFIAFTINSAGLFLPTVCGMFWRKSNSTAAFSSIMIALVIVVGWYIGGLVSSAAVFKIDALWPAFGVSAVAYIILCLTTNSSKLELEKAELFYAAKR
ncbi:MAG: sodium:solute symporter family protein [Oscillospiraceae bacterium]